MKEILAELCSDNHIVQMNTSIAKVNQLIYDVYKNIDNIWEYNFGKMKYFIELIPDNIFFREHS